jgi:hypothetical protein
MIPPEFQNIKLLLAILVHFEVEVISSKPLNFIDNRGDLLLLLVALAKFRFFNLVTNILFLFFRSGMLYFCDLNKAINIKS